MRGEREYWVPSSNVAGKSVMEFCPRNAGMDIRMTGCTAVLGPRLRV